MEQPSPAVPALEIATESVATSQVVAQKTRATGQLFSEKFSLPPTPRKKETDSFKTIGPAIVLVSFTLLQISATDGACQIKQKVY